MVEKHTSEYICKAGRNRDLFIDSGGLCSKYQIKTMKSQALENSLATRTFKYMSQPSGLVGITLTPEAQLEVTVSRLCLPRAAAEARLW